MTWEVCCRRTWGREWPTITKEDDVLFRVPQKDPFIHEYEAKGDDIDNQNKCNF